jgi:2-polyprenyl-6-hydroxyphenyl methylase/3-demethylubiquinone-9 3-methyltransferase
MFYNRKLFITDGSGSLGNVRPEIPKGADYHESLAERWSGRYKSGGFANRIKLFNSFFQRSVQPGTVWLDAGCGSGVLSNEIASFGAKVFAVDASPRMIKAALLMNFQSKECIEFHTINTIESLTFSNSLFDGCVCSSVIEYLNSPSLALAEIARTMKPEGILIISVPNRYSLVRGVQAFLRRLLLLFGIDKFSYLAVSVNTFNFFTFKLELEKNGFSVVSYKYFDPLLPILKSFSSLIVFHAIKKRNFQ